MRGADAAPAEVIDAPVTERDWQHEAWRRVQTRSTSQRYGAMTLDQALADRHLGPIVRAFGAWLRRRATR